MWEKIDKLYLGIIVGLLLPIILFFAFYSADVMKLVNEDPEFVTKSGEIKKVLPAALPALLTRVVFPNAIIFFLLIWQNRLKISKGILIVTAILTGILTILELAY